MSSGKPIIKIEIAPWLGAAELVDTVTGGVADLFFWELRTDVLVDAPIYTCADITGNSRLAVPHAYVETLVLPLAKYYALAAGHTVKPDVAAAIEKQAAEALALIGQVDPRETASQKEDPQ